MTTEPKTNPRALRRLRVENAATGEAAAVWLSQAICLCGALVEYGQGVAVCLVCRRLIEVHQPENAALATIEPTGRA